KPYDRFVQEQLAGDELAGFAPGGDVTGGTVELLEATHFLRNAPDGTSESDGNPDEVRIDRFTVLEGNLQNTMNCLLGITIQCARCHAHKFEPIRHDEYYRLQAILYPVYPAYGPERWTQPNNRVVTIATRARREEHQRTTERLQRQIRALEADPEPPVHHVLHRGQHHIPAAEVQPGVPAALDPQDRFRIDGRPPGQISSGRRLAFARWVTAAENPLFARVMVNRIWQHHFG